MPKNDPFLNFIEFQAVDFIKSLIIGRSMKQKCYVIWSKTAWRRMTNSISPSTVESGLKEFLLRIKESLQISKDKNNEDNSITLLLTDALSMSDIVLIE